MKINSKLQLILQVGIAVTCLIMVFIVRSEIPVQAQGCAVKFYNETPTNPMGDAIPGSWSPYNEVIVKIDGRWNSTERGLVENGIKNWNGQVPIDTCSHVSFKDFGVGNFTDVDNESNDWAGEPDPPTMYANQ